MNCIVSDHCVKINIHNGASLMSLNLMRLDLEYDLLLSELKQALSSTSVLVIVIVDACQEGSGTLEDGTGNTEKMSVGWL